MKNSIMKLIVFVGIWLIVFACTAVNNKNLYKASTEETTEDTMNEYAMEKQGVQLWAETCNRCHIAPSPIDYNDTDWETISLHMRVRANLTAEDSKKIEVFLKSAN